MKNSAMRRPKREPVIETSWKLILELDRPGGTAVQCLVNPVLGQFEQILNALYLQKLGYGMFAAQLTHESLTDFLQQTAQLSEALRCHEQAGNGESFAALDLQISRAAERSRKGRRVGN